MTKRADLPDDTGAADETSAERYRMRDRRARILELLEHRDFVGVRELAEMFEMTEVSVRRDLAILAEDGLITRKRGGAVRPRVGRTSHRFAEDTQTNAQVKARISRTAAELIKPGNSVLFYSGSTVAKVASSIPPDVRSTLTIVSNSLPVIDEVGSWTDPHLVAVGGLYLPQYMAFVGPQANNAFKELSADIAIIGASGLSAAFGLTTPHQLIAEVGGTIVERATTTIVVADSSKIGRGGLTPIAPLRSVHTLVTDAASDPEELAALRRVGIEVIVV
jgi:DeoR/GlpR family transcriptional regulator of sugar metabolism